MRDWGHVSEAYERSFARLCAGTIPRLLTDAAGPRVLDVGCGSGELAERAEGKGRAVTAVDADPAMAARTRERIVGEVLEAALPHLPLPGDAFDSVVANFVINHVARPADAVAELARVVRPGGSAAMTIWPSGGAAWQDLVAECFDAADFAPVPSERLPTALDFERTGAGLAVLAFGAGLVPRIVEDLRWEWDTAPADLWSGIRAGIGGAGAAYLAQDVRTRAQADAEFRNRTAADDRLRLTARASYGVAEKPSSTAQ
jgi:SAM-dependent methyltransferase